MPGHHVSEGQRPAHRWPSLDSNPGLADVEMLFNRRPRGLCSSGVTRLSFRAESGAQRVPLCPPGGRRHRRRCGHCDSDPLGVNPDSLTVSLHFLIYSRAPGVLTLLVQCDVGTWGGPCPSAFLTDPWGHQGCRVQVRGQQAPEPGQVHPAPLSVLPRGPGPALLICRPHGLCATGGVQGSDRPR